MAFIETRRATNSTGGGGIAIAGFETDIFTHNAPFTAGSLSFNLSQTPVDTEAVVGDYNGQVLRNGTDYTIAGNVVTIQFADPYLPYENPVVFQFTYPYS